MIITIMVKITAGINIKATKEEEEETTIITNNKIKTVVITRISNSLGTADKYSSSSILEISLIMGLSSNSGPKTLHSNNLSKVN